MKKALKTVPRGTAFNYAGQRWVVLEHNATGTLCLTEKIVEDRAFDDGNCNDFSQSSSLRYLNGPFLDTLIDAAGCSGASGCVSGGGPSGSCGCSGPSVDGSGAQFSVVPP